MTSLLRVEDLHVSFRLRGKERQIIKGVSFELERGESLSLVGESGSGKSVTVRTVMGLNPAYALIRGNIYLDDVLLNDLSAESFRQQRISRMAMIFQDPRAHINPVRKIGDFLTEAMIHLGGVSRVDATTRAVEFLKQVGIPNGPERMNQYPHQLSGGLLQRIMIAGALAMDPDLLLADEPTTALDVTTQEEVMAILGSLQESRDLGVLLITHDLDLAAATCSRTAVMRSGELVEIGYSEDVLHHPQHPYTRALLTARPDINALFPELTGEHPA